MMKNLQKIRESKGFSQLKVGVAIESSQEVISAYESGKYGIGSDNLNKLADYFQCSTDYLLDRTDDPTPVSLLSNNLSEEDTKLLTNYKMLSKDTREILNIFIQSLIEKNK